MIEINKAIRENRMQDLERMIQEAISDVKYHERKLTEAELRIESFEREKQRLEDLNAI